MKDERIRIICVRALCNDLPQQALYIDGDGDDPSRRTLGVLESGLVTP